MTFGQVISAEDVEARALEAAQAEAARTREIFDKGGYPGLCEDAYDDACQHPVRHVIPEAEKQRIRNIKWDR